MSMKEIDITQWTQVGEDGLPMFDLGHLFLFCNIFSKQKRVQEIPT